MNCSATISLWNISAGLGTSAYTLCVCWWYWPCLSNQDIGRPGSSRTTYRTTRQSTTTQTATATRRTKPHEARDSNRQSFQQQKHWSELETSESWSVENLFTWQRTKYGTLLRILTDRKHNVLWNLPVARMTALTLTWIREQDITMATV